MGGINPYNQSAEPVLPTEAFKVTFEPMGKTVQVDPKSYPYSDDGLPGSGLDIALGHGLDVDHACGGVNACSTCHVIVEQGFETCQEAGEDEEDMLDTAPGLELKSRLACQAVPNGSSDLVVRIPSWNRNHAKEAPH